MSISIHSLYIYPIKSCQGIQFDSLELVETGFKYDRHWMVVDKQGQFLSQRKHPEMATIKTALSETSLLVSTSKMDEQLEIPLHNDNDYQLQVNIWKDQCRAQIVSTQASQWFSQFLEIPCDLVYLPENEHRLVDPVYAKNKQRVGFADGFPLLIVSRSIEDTLSEKLGERIRIDRFRANIILAGCEAHAEDQWSEFTVNGIDILLAKPCSRCIIPSINQQSAEKHDSLLRTLAGYRRFDGKIYIGQNGLHQSTGIIKTNQQVFIKEK